MRAHGLSGIWIRLESLVQPLPPFADVRIASFGSLSLHPPTQAPPTAAYPAAHHPVDCVNFDNALVDHRSPHLAGTVHRQGSVEEARVAPDRLGVSVVGQPEYAAHSASYLLRLDCPDDVDGGMIAPVPDGVTQLDEPENHADDDGRGRYEIGGCSEIHASRVWTARRALPGPALSIASFDPTPAPTVSGSPPTPDGARFDKPWALTPLTDVSTGEQFRRQIEWPGPFLVSLLGISLGVADAVRKVGTFVMFGLGFGLPLVVLSLLTSVRSRTVVRWIVSHHRAVEVISGVLFVAIGTFDFIDKWQSIRVTLGL